MRYGHTESNGQTESKEWLEPLRLTLKQRNEAIEAYGVNPRGVRRLVREAMTRANPAAAFLARLRRGEHLRPDNDHRPITGWRFVRGTHSGTFVEDPRGRDRLPTGYL